MTGNEGDIVAQGEQAFLDRSEQGFVIATREIRPSNRALEQDVSDLGQPARCVEEDDMTRGVARAMQYVKHDLTKRHLIAILQPARRRKTAHIRKAKHFALLRHAIDPELVFRMRSFDRHPGLLGQGRNPAGMINMAVRHQNFGQGQLFVGQDSPNTLNVTARINHGRLPRCLTPENSAVLLEGGNGNDGVAHDILAYSLEGADYRTRPSLPGTTALLKLTSTRNPPHHYA